MYYGHDNPNGPFGTTRVCLRTEYLNNKDFLKGYQPKIKYSVIVGDCAISHNTVVTLYDENCDYLGWCYMMTEIKYGEGAVAADFSELSKDLKKILRVGLNKDGYHKIPEMIAEDLGL